MAAVASFINSMLDTAFTGTFTMKLFKTSLPSTGGVEVSGGGYSAQTLTYGSASGKIKQTSSAAVFTNMPTGQTVVAYGVYNGATLVDENTFSTPFTADVSSNTLSVNHKFDLSGI